MSRKDYDDRCKSYKEELTRIVLSGLGVKQEHQKKIPAIYTLYDKKTNEVIHIRCTRSLSTTIIFLFNKNNKFSIVSAARHMASEKTTDKDRDNIIGEINVLLKESEVYIVVDKILSDRDDLYLEKIKVMKDKGLKDMWASDIQLSKYICNRILQAGISIDTILKLTETKVFPDN